MKKNDASEKKNELLFMKMATPTFLEYECHVTISQRSAQHTQSREREKTRKQKIK